MIQKKNLSTWLTQLFEKLSSFTCFEVLGQTNSVQGIVGMNSLINYFFRRQNKYNLTKISTELLSNCKRTRLFLNTNVKIIKYSDKRPNTKTTLVFQRSGKERIKSYDYIVIAFPLTKNLKKQSCSLDILYRDFLDCELNSVFEYLVDGNVSFMLPTKADKLIHFYFDDPTCKFKLIRAHLPMKKPSHVFFDLVLYSVFSTEPLDEASFDKLFDKGYKVIDKLSSYEVPLYKKVRYSHTPFPQIIIDEEKRSRIFYLNSQEWLLGGSKECSCRDACNIALLIAKKELGQSFFKSHKSHNATQMSADFDKKNMLRSWFKNSFVYFLFNCNEMIKNILAFCLLKKS